MKNHILILNRQKRLGNQSLWDLRRLRDMTIPDGVWRIHAQMFKYSCLESVAIPASVTELGKEAFYECRKLRRVTFAKGSKLKKIK